ncbi:Gfo/Idh/MocA family protein [Roseicitreum antarcticum]|uniref:Oxidoreductase family, C-terminal alpha/beta domain n=1 Tax=Roseicitreum antarcticum TaxID=564137 RepID=A0A1H2ZAE2_9RHOB|nr:Gfo/Idh/MocA family oxidoreductase [Roseicitreum antarcticum]SDX13814.1 Oxidoreductase family, C-terminal alpha/beta domain [Roseicitreum antarcticum]
MRFVIVGCGSRHEMFVKALTVDYAGRHQLVGLCDLNPVRLHLSQALAAQAGVTVPGYDMVAFGQMLTDQRPDAVIVTTPDHLHARYIIDSLEAGCDVICEKPLTVDLPSLQAISAAQARTGRRVTVTFNYRYAPARSQLHELLDAGVIGTVTAVTFRWRLDRVHGADYFRRWHRQKANSGGLQVHKCTHHFDLLNWWLDTTPNDVAASGQRAFYTPQTAERLGLSGHSTRCATCPVAQKCDFRLDLDTTPRLKAMYRAAEGADGYFRDLCIWDPAIGIEDTIQAHIRYASGVSANYSLTAYAPQEGFDVTFIGTEGELSHSHDEVHGIFGGTRPKGLREAMRTTLHRSGHAPEAIAIPEGGGDHGGADPVMLGYLLAPETMPAHAHLAAPDHMAGCWSVGTGLAVGAAIASGQVVSVRDMVASV